MLAYAKLLREKEGLSVLPASTAGLIALIDWHQKQPLANDRFVAVLTGKRT
jgi:threonine synthase